MNHPKPLSAPAAMVRHTIPAAANLVPPLRQQFFNSISHGELKDSDLASWQLVFNEMLFNAITHGAKDNPDEFITVEWGTTENEIILVVQDPGQGPPDALLHAPSLPSEITSESGRGLFIIFSFGNNVSYWRGPNGFRLEVRKSYPGRGLQLLSNPELDSVLDELSTCYESLSVFHSLTESLIESANLRDFIGTSLDEFLSLHPHDRIFIQGAPSIPETIRLSLNPATWFLDPNDVDTTFKALGTLTRETVWENPEDLVRQNLDFGSLASVAAGCVFPIVAGDIHFGALIVLRKSTASDLKFRSLGTLRTLADLCGIACANAHLTNIRDESQKDLRELEIAVEIQKALLPILPAPESDRWLVSIHQESSLTIAGDYAIAATDADGNLVIAMIDVMGKGVSAALLASIFRTAFDMSLHIRPASAMLETINRTLCKQLGDLSMFITCSIARVAVDGRSLDHASAGHCPTFFYQHDGSCSFFHPSGPPLGILPDINYVSDVADLHGGERIVFVTDGCYEWDRAGDYSAWQAFVERIDRLRQAPAEMLWDELRKSILASQGSALEDDCTLITLDILK